jgi:hypothetical protein
MYTLIYHSLQSHLCESMFRMSRSSIFRFRLGCQLLSNISPIKIPRDYITSFNLAALLLPVQRVSADDYLHLRRSVSNRAPVDVERGEKQDLGRHDELPNQQDTVTAGIHAAPPELANKLHGRTMSLRSPRPACSRWWSFSECTG